MKTAKDDIERVLLPLHTTLREYDEQQSRKRSYNRFAFGHYMRAIGHVRIHLQSGRDLRTSLLNEFLGSLANRLVKAAKLDPMNADELRGYGFERYPDVSDD